MPFFPFNIGCTQFSRFHGSRQSFEAEHGILQNAQVGGDPLELNVDDAVFPESQYGRGHLSFQAVGELLQPRLGEVLHILAELSNVLIEIREFIQRCAGLQRFCQVLQLPDTASAKARTSFLSPRPGNS